MADSQPYQMKFWDPASGGRGKQSYARPDVAVANARSAALSRQVRVPDSHVIVIDNARMLVLWEWHGGTGTDYPEATWQRACQYDLAGDTDSPHPPYAVPAVTAVNDEYSGTLRICAACAAHWLQRHAPQTAAAAADGEDRVDAVIAQLARYGIEARRSDGGHAIEIGIGEAEKILTTVHAGLVATVDAMRGRRE